jgi:hypothetical protein
VDVNFLTTFSFTLSSYFCSSQLALLPSSYFSRPPAPPHTNGGVLGAPYFWHGGAAPPCPLAPPLATGEQIPTNFDTFSETADIINPTEVYVDRFRGFELKRGQLKSCCSRLPVIVSKFSSDIPPPLLTLVLMLYYWNSRIIKQQVISQTSKVFGAMCARRLKVFVIWSSGTRL